MLKELPSNLGKISAGSSLRSLLVNGIFPKFHILLERAGAVYDEVKSLCDEGFDLSGIILIASNTVDPNLTQIYKETYFYTRPFSSAAFIFDGIDNLNKSQLSVAGPESTNAALEVAIELQPKNIYLFGCDFGSPSRDSPRSATAAGLNSRELADPRRGSLGKTIFTQSTLELAATIFNTLLSSYRGQCYRIGQGLKLSNALNIDRNKFHDLVLTSSIVTLLSTRSPIVILKFKIYLRISKLAVLGELKGN